MSIATMLNEWMVRVKYAERFGRAQKVARARRAGLRASGGFGCLPRDYRRNRCLIGS
jgi:endonuclease YncB( thermonuclease family)